MTFAAGFKMKKSVSRKRESQQERCFPNCLKILSVSSAASVKSILQKNKQMKALKAFYALKA